MIHNFTGVFITAILNIHHEPLMHAKYFVVQSENVLIVS